MKNDREIYGEPFESKNKNPCKEVFGEYKYPYKNKMHLEKLTNNSKWI